MERRNESAPLETLVEWPWQRRLRVARLKEAVRKGIYEVSPEDVAASLMERVGVDFLLQHA